MYPVSSDFVEALHSPSQVVAVRVSTTGGVPLMVTGGSVEMDGRRAIQRSCSLTFTRTPDMSLGRVYDTLMSPSTEIIVERGLTLDGSTEYVPLGVFSTDTASFALDAGGSVAWKGSDRSNKVRRARLIEPYHIASGTALATAAVDVLTDRYPSIEYDFTGVSEIIGTNVILQAGPDSDPWKDMQRLFFNYGYDLHFAGDGRCTATILADVPTAFSFGQGETSLMLGGEVAGALDRVYNGVVATGEGTDVTAPVRAIVWDDNAASPTYYLGAYGMVPYFYTSSLLTTQAQCLSAAKTILARVRGGEQVLSWPAVVNPALEPNDTVEVYINGVPAQYTLDRLTIPLHASGTMGAVAREGAVTW